MITITNIPNIFNKAFEEVIPLKNDVYGQPLNNVTTIQTERLYRTIDDAESYRKRIIQAYTQRQFFFEIPVYERNDLDKLQMSEFIDVEINFNGMRPKPFRVDANLSF